MNFKFFIESILLGIGLAMDAFAVSVANGLNEPNMSKKKRLSIPGVFALFQGLMPLIGWFFVHQLIQYFKVFEKAVPYISLGLLAFIGIKMIWDSVKGEEEETRKRVGIIALLLQGIATSIDALSVGFTIAEYDFPMAAIEALIIAAITFIICVLGVWIGRKVGDRFSKKASIFGGIILIAIGLEIFITNLF